MKYRKMTTSALFTLLFAASANAQETVIAQIQDVDEYNGLKSLIVLAIMILALVFLYRSSKRKSAENTDNQDVKIETENGSVPGEVIAAIMMMLNDMDEDVHDNDSTVLTLRKVTRNYSPWNSKIFGLRQTPYKK